MLKLKRKRKYHVGWDRWKNHDYWLWRFVLVSMRDGTGDAEIEMGIPFNNAQISTGDTRRP